MTPTELGYLSGVTSNIQDQLNGKAEDVSIMVKDKTLSFIIYGDGTHSGNRTPIEIILTSQNGHHCRIQFSVTMDNGYPVSSNYIASGTIGINNFHYKKEDETNYTYYCIEFYASSLWGQSIVRYTKFSTSDNTISGFYIAYGPEFTDGSTLTRQYVYNAYSSLGSIYEDGTKLSDKYSLASHSHTGIEYLDGVTSNIQTQLNSKSEEGQVHEEYVTVNILVHASTTAFTIYGDGINDTTRVPIQINLVTQFGYGFNIDLAVKLSNGNPIGDYYTSSNRNYKFKWCTLRYLDNGNNSTTYIISSLYGGWGNGCIIFNRQYSGFYIVNDGYNILSLDGTSTLSEAQQIYFPYFGDTLPDGAIYGAMFLLKA